jgi:membrane protease YdiL (CAAX protease family)
VFIAVGAVLTLGISLVISRLVLHAVVGEGWPIVVYVTLSALLGYGPVLTWCVLATRRVSDDPWRERLGLEFRRVDLGWAPVVYAATFGVQMVIGVIIVATRIPITSNVESFDVSENRTYALSLLVLAVVAAPIAEEVTFRCVVLRGLLSRIGPVPAIAVQGVLFGCAHFDPIRGVGNIGLVMVTAGIGASFGAAAYWMRRISITIGAHAILNAIALTLVLSGVAERLQS